MKKEEPKDRLQARLEPEEMIEFFNDWQELAPEMDWSQFCRAMVKKGIILERIDQENIRRGRESLFSEKELLSSQDNCSAIGTETVVGHIEQKRVNKKGNSTENQENVN